MLDAKPAKYGSLWTREELILAFDLYCRIPFKKTKTSNPEVCALANILGRSSAAVARKLGNFGAFDPQLKERDISGLSHGSRLDREVWDEFHTDWNGLVLKAHKLRGKMEKAVRVPKKHATPTGPSERISISRQRVHQTFFREAVLSAYQWTCGITGITIHECLVAGHIVPWSQSEEHRTDPTNGLCLSATFHNLFDAGLLTITDDLHIRIAKEVTREVDTPNARNIFAYDGKPLHRPQRFLPSQGLLAWHRKHVFRTC